MEVEDSVFVVFRVSVFNPESARSLKHTSLALATTGTAATVILVPLTIEDLTGLDLNYGFVGLSTNSLRKTTGVTIASHDGRDESCDSSKDSRELHVGSLK